MCNYYISKIGLFTGHFCIINRFYGNNSIPQFNNVKPSVTVNGSEDNRMDFLVVELNVGSARIRFFFPFSPGKPQKIYLLKAAHSDTFLPDYYLQFYLTINKRTNLKYKGPAKSQLFLVATFL